MAPIPPRALVAAGTRPELVKLAPVVTSLRLAGVTVEVVRTGQHTDPLMAGDGLGALPTGEPPWALAGSEAERVGQLTERAFARMAEDDRRPDVVVVQGDTFTAALVAMAARRHAIPVAHVEAGLRSGNERSQEELNRRMLATLATVHLAPTAGAAQNLIDEGVPAERVHVVGNPICDVLAETGIERVAPADRRGVLLTAHRATNVDDPERLAAIVTIARRLAAEVAPVAIPLHPRTRDRLETTGLMADLVTEHIELTPPLGHRDLLVALAGSLLTVTDSGGLQEEASWFGVPVVVLRPSTPRPEGVEMGQAALVGLDADRALRAALHLTTPNEARRIAGLPCPYGDGLASDRMAQVLVAAHAAGTLRVPETELSDPRGRRSVVTSGARP